ncbi:cell wall hydrolase [Oricola cellulosilytica]|nr:cell wall hydrolase [Oricola cellulosilytica]
MKTFATIFLTMNTLLGAFSTAAQAGDARQIALHVNYIAARAFSGSLAVPPVPRIGDNPIERICMTAALYHEARGEPLTGQLAVARVILNRARSSAYPDSVCGVVYQNAHWKNRCQFSFACDGRSDYPRNARSFRALDALSSAIFDSRLTDRLVASDPREIKAGNFDQITHYHTTAVSPSWGRKIGRIGQIGAHIFYRSERVARSL